MITTYEKHSTAFNVLQYGFKPIVEAYRVKDYKMRKVGDIKTHSLRRLERILTHSNRQLSNTGENWFKTVHYFDRDVTYTPYNLAKFDPEIYNKACELAYSGKVHSHQGIEYVFCGPYVLKLQDRKVIHVTSHTWASYAFDRWGSFTHAAQNVLYNLMIEGK